MLRITVDGDAEGGWMAEIHDGDAVTKHTPADCADAFEAMGKAMQERWPDGPPRAGKPAAAPVPENPAEHTNDNGGGTPAA